jgi:hypothetical protein
MTTQAAPKDCSACRAGQDPANAIIRAGGSRASNKDYFQYSIPRTTLAAGAPGVSQTLQIPMLPDSYHVVTHLFAVSSGVFTAQLRNDSDGKYYHTPTALVRNVNLFGTLQLPNKLKDPIVLAPNATLSVTLADIANSGNNIVQIVLCGYRHFDFANPPIPKKGGRRSDWFGLVIDKVLSGYEGPSQILVKIDADADFLVRKLVAVSTAEFLAKIVDSGSANAWSDQPQRNANLFGTAQYPLVLPKPKLVKAGNFLTFELTEMSGSSNTVQIFVEGAKIR